MAELKEKEQEKLPKDKSGKPEREKAKAKPEANGDEAEGESKKPVEAKKPAETKKPADAKKPAEPKKPADAKKSAEPKKPAKLKEPESESDSAEEGKAAAKSADAKAAEPAKKKKKKKSQGVWGIDIGQCGLKALRCTVDGDTVVAEAFDFIEYPKILSQPESNPDELIADAIREFLSRNQVKGDKIAISVPGQSGLAKFFKPPPIDAKRIPDIVRYEARQQIPFPLDEVIWDFQKLAGGQEVDGFAIETEVGLFAMKREQVFKFIRPFQEAEIPLDIVQLAPLCAYNFVSHDVLVDGPSEEEFDPENPPESLVVLAMGTDSTDLVVTNGFRLWQRNIPLGGNHFTKQLTKDLKLTFAKAEHLKRNSRQAEDPKTIFQAMRPVFHDLVTEVQRSIGFFQSIDRKAKINGILMLGNTVKLPGLQQYVAKNLGYEVVEFKSFSRLTGSSVISSPVFKDNMLSFGVCYGLCLQGLGLAKISTNLIPRQILIDRLVESKKPWTVAAVGALMLGCALHFAFDFSAWAKSHSTRTVANVTWSDAEGKADRVKKDSDDHKKKDDERVATLKHLSAIAQQVVGDRDRRILWLELLKAVNESLPATKDAKGALLVKPGQYVSIKKLPFEKREELYIEGIESQYFPDLKEWFTDEVKKRYLEGQPGAGGEKALEAGKPGDPPVGAANASVKVEGPKGPGWVVEITGYHYFNEVMSTQGRAHLRRTLLQNLELGEVKLPGDPQSYTVKELGISFPILADDKGGAILNTRVPNPDYKFDDAKDRGQPGGGAGGIGGVGGFGQQPVNQPKADSDDPNNLPEFIVKKYTFAVQFCWQEQPLSERLKLRELQRQKLEAEEGESGAGQPPGTVATNVNKGVK